MISPHRMISPNDFPMSKAPAKRDALSAAGDPNTAFGGGRLLDMVYTCTFKLL